MLVWSGGWAMRNCGRVAKLERSGRRLQAQVVHIRDEQRTIIANGWPMQAHVYTVRLTYPAADSDEGETLVKEVNVKRLTYEQVEEGGELPVVVDPDDDDFVMAAAVVDGPSERFGGRVLLLAALGTVPAIIDGELKLADSEAIAEYLDEHVPAPPMMPANPESRARAREISRFHDTRLEPVIRGYFGQVAPATRDADYIATNARLLQDRLDQLAIIASPAPLMTGPDLAIADCGFVASFGIIALLQDLLDLQVTLPDPVAAYATLLATHPSVAPEDARYRTVLARWAETKLKG